MLPPLKCFSILEANFVENETMFDIRVKKEWKVVDIYNLNYFLWRRYNISITIQMDTVRSLDKFIFRPEMVCKWFSSYSLTYRTCF